MDGAEHALVAVAALLVALLTLFSGFGLGTLLLPVFLLVAPAPVAVAATAVVHLLNNLLKVALVGATARRDVILRFGAAAVPAAFLGAWLLESVSGMPPLGSWSAGDAEFRATPVGLAMGLLMVGFAALELWPGLEDLEFDPKVLPVGGLVSGFFGGLSGHQGAFRTAFLARLRLSAEEFVATSAVLACLVDAARLLVYGAARLGAEGEVLPWGLVASGVAGASVGSFLGVRVLRKWKVTLRAVRLLSGVLLLAFGALLAAGVL